jgi:hypothetical protein
MTSRLHISGVRNLDTSHRLNSQRSHVESYKACPIPTVWDGKQVGAELLNTGTVSYASST